jgi:hypothetical protein
MGIQAVLVTGIVAAVVLQAVEVGGLAVQALQVQVAWEVWVAMDYFKLIRRLISKLYLAQRMRLLRRQHWGEKTT